MSYIPLAGLQQSSKKIAVKQALRSQTEGGYTFSRAKSTKVKYKFSLDFIVTKTEFNTLEAFFIANNGKNFSILFDSITYTVTFTIDELDYEVLAKDLRRLSISLTEV